jgi:hypothetical protein
MLASMVAACRDVGLLRFLSLLLTWQLPKALRRMPPAACCLLPTRSRAVCFMRRE